MATRFYLLGAKHRLDRPAPIDLGLDAPSLAVQLRVHGYAKHHDEETWQRTTDAIDRIEEGCILDAAELNDLRMKLVQTIDKAFA